MKQIDKKFIDSNGEIDFYELCCDYMDNSRNFFDYLYDNTEFDTMDGEIYSIDMPKSDLFNDDLIEWAEDTIERPLNIEQKKELFKEWKSFYAYNEDELQDKLEEEYVNRNDDGDLYD